jgi:hypothetical protein
VATVPPPDPDETLRLPGAGSGDTARVDGGLAGWLAELASDDAARARARGHWLGRQAAEEGTFAGILEDLAERGRPVLVHLHNGRLHRGALILVGADFVVLRAGAGPDVVLARSAVASVRTLPGEPATSGDRVAASGATLAEMLSVLADDRARVMVIGLDVRHTVTGELRALGRDVLTVRLGGEGGTAYVPLDSVAEISLVESG